MNICSNPYSVLGVAPDAPLAVIKKAYLKLLLRYHPDKNRDPKAAGKLEKIINAYNSILYGEKFEDELPSPSSATRDYMEQLGELADAQQSLLDDDAEFETANEVLDAIKKGNLDNIIKSCVANIDAAEAAFLQARRDGKTIPEAKVAYKKAFAKK